jgi:hypothetical protein
MIRPCPRSLGARPARRARRQVIPRPLRQGLAYPPGEHHRQAHGPRRRPARGVAQGGPAATALSAPWRRKRPPAEAPAGTPGQGSQAPGHARRSRAASGPSAPPPPPAPGTGTSWGTECPPGKQSRGSSPPPPRAAPGRQAPACGLIMPTGNQLTVPFLLTTYGTLWYIV